MRENQHGSLGHGTIPTIWLWRTGRGRVPESCLASAASGQWTVWHFDRLAGSPGQINCNELFEPKLLTDKIETVRESLEHVVEMYKRK